MEKQEGVLLMPACECEWQGTWYELENDHKCPKCGRAINETC